MPNKNVKMGCGILLGLAVLIPIALDCAYNNSAKFYPLTKQETFSMLRHGVPLGSSVSEVKTWLYQCQKENDHWHVDNYKAISVNPTIDESNSNLQKSLPGLFPSHLRITGYYRAEIYSTSGGWLNPVRDTEIYLYFGPDHKLAKYSVDNDKYYGF